MRSSALVFLAIVVIALLASPIAAQQRNPRVIVSLEQGGFAAFKIEVTPLEVHNASVQPLQDFSVPVTARVVRGAGNVLHRMLVDEHGKLIFAYDLVIQELESPSRFRVAARPPAPGLERRLRLQNPDAFEGIVDTTGTPPTLTAATSQQTVDDGETFALDLLVNESLGVKVVDYVTVASQRWLLSPRRPAQPARDFGLSNVELAVRNYELFIDDVPVVSRSSKRTCIGALIWFAVPDQGRFIFSLVPYEGYDFRKVGVIEDNKIVFSWKGVRYEWTSREHIVGSGGAWNVWVLHEPDYVDLFTPALEKEPKTRTAHLFPEPVGITLPPPKRKTNPTGLGKVDKIKPEVSWITIGGAKRIEDLLAK
jgi:hypothetical protein